MFGSKTTRAEVFEMYQDFLAIVKTHKKEEREKAVLELPCGPPRRGV